LEPLKRLGEEKRRTDSIRIASLQGISMLSPHLFRRGPVCYGIGIPTVAELTFVNNHFPSIFFATPSRSTWLFAVQKGRPVAGFKDTSK
jgi:hypothetical protein